MRTTNVLFILSLLFTLYACGDHVDAPMVPMVDAKVGPAPVQQKRTIVIRTDGLTEVHANAVLEGCRVWTTARDIVCEFESPDGPAADVTVTIDADDECLPDEDGNYYAGYAHWPERVIDLYQGCIGLAARGRDLPMERMMALIATHEFGHMIGIWDHVPPTCEDEHQTAPDGSPLCGYAVMNSTPFYKLIGLTADLDLFAFDMRNTVDSVLNDLRPVEKSLSHGNGHGCAMRVLL